MSDVSPKLYTTKPKKSQLKQHKGKEFYSPPSMETPPPPPPPPPQPPKESFARRYKFMWPLLLTVNLAVGAYLFMRTKKKDTSIEDAEAVVNAPSAPIASVGVATLTTPQIPPPVPPITEPPKVLQPIPEDQQRELFKWILEEKRKVKPKDPQERKHIDEEKAVLKQFIRAKSIPTI
ncbi:PREDICTED: WAS/WASL-interacting protein family member 3-like [Nelumbo nucifera]|uniref:WAS/WASL-interacting protein family member 3-like n=1 Tax=Nelumbo nucifera TaxID=4432 RepID=A0A1U8AIZ8_NELNU|nr:PREDICTED: WAS/WASL-interacting protein family member 3-like [Nelumbo nucifera]